MYHNSFKKKTSISQFLSYFHFYAINPWSDKLFLISCYYKNYRSGLFLVTFSLAFGFIICPKTCIEVFPLVNHRVQIFLKLMVKAGFTNRIIYTPPVAVLSFWVLLLTIRRGIHTAHFRPSMFPACLVVMEEDIRIRVTQTGTALRFCGTLKDPFDCVIWGVIILSLFALT